MLHNCRKSWDRPDVFLRLCIKHQRVMLAKMERVVIGGARQRRESLPSSSRSLPQ